MVRKINAYLFFFFGVTLPCSGAQLCCLCCPALPTLATLSILALHSTATKAKTQGILSTRTALSVWHRGKEQTVGLEGTVTHSRPEGFQLGNPGLVILKAGLSSVLDPRPPHHGPQRFKLGEELRSLAQNKSSGNISALFSHQDFL